ncbi:MAG: hypothetical protein J4F38_03990 [Pseudomonadales bacterium]|nr:hypothetical protein [Pseudomonadales bacterium]
MTPDHVSQYKNAGYTIVPGFFAPAEAAALKREVDRWVTAGLPRDVSITDFVNMDHASHATRAGHRWQHVHVTGEGATGGEREYREVISFEAEMGLCASTG